MGECTETNYDISHKDIAGRGMNVLHLAVHCIDVGKTKEMVKQLKKKGLLNDALRKESDYGQTPLGFAEETLRNLRQTEKVYSKELTEMKHYLGAVKKNIKNVEKIRKTLQATSGGSRNTRRIMDLS